MCRSLASRSWRKRRACCSPQRLVRRDPVHIPVVVVVLSRAFICALTTGMRGNVAAKREGNFNSPRKDSG